MRIRKQRACCAECGREILTLRGSVSVSGAPVLCRKCFGEQTYKGGNRWMGTSILPESASIEQAA